MGVVLMYSTHSGVGPAEILRPATGNSNNGEAAITDLDAKTRAPGELRRAWVLALTVLAASASALETGEQTWTTGQVLLPVAREAHIGLRYRTRFSGVLEGRSLYQYQATATRRLDRNTQLTAGYEHFRLRRGSLEHRVFPQLDLSTRLFGARLRHRLRAELRDLDTFDERIWRLRYQLSLTRPIGEAGAYFSLVDEIFYSASEVDGRLRRGFNQNRIGGALGYRLGEHARVEFGYQWEYLDSGFAERGEHLFQFNFVWDGR